MTSDTIRDISLRTLAADAAAIAQNTGPQAQRISLHIRTLAPVAMQDTHTAIGTSPSKKRSPLLIIGVVIFLLAALGGSGYFVYKSMTTPYVNPQ